MAEIDYIMISVISMLSGFGGALGAELARAFIKYLTSPKKKRRRKPQSAISPSVLSLILIFGFIILVGILFRVLVPAEVMKQLLSNPYL